MKIDTRAVRYGQIEAWLQEHGRLVVCSIVRTQGSVPRRVGARMVVLPDGSLRGTVGGGLFEALVKQDALAALESGTSRTKTYDFRESGSSPHAFGAVCGGTAELFFEVACVAEHLLIVGAGHCGRALVQAATLLDRFRITLVDERLEDTDDTLPDSIERAILTEGYPELPSLVDSNTCVALVSRGALTDELALRQVISSEARYIGMMGSRKKVRTVFDSLRESGIDESLLARVHAPIGLEIGAETPAEIAISILGQIIANIAAKGKSVSGFYPPVQNR